MLVSRCGRKVKEYKIPSMKTPGCHPWRTTLPLARAEALDRFDRVLCPVLAHLDNVTHGFTAASASRAAIACTMRRWLEAISAMVPVKRPVTTAGTKWPQRSFNQAACRAHEGIAGHMRHRKVEFEIDLRDTFRRMFRIVEFRGDDVRETISSLEACRAAARGGSRLQREADFRQMGDEFLIIPASHRHPSTSGSKRNSSWSDQEPACPPWPWAQPAAWLPASSWSPAARCARHRNVARVRHHWAVGSLPQSGRDDGAAEVGNHMGVAVPAFSSANRRFEQPQ